MIENINVVPATDVVDEQIFGDVWAFLMENYSDDAEKLVQATLATKVAYTLLIKELGIPDFEVKVGEDE